MAKACEATQAQKKLNITKIAYKYGVPYTILYECIKNNY